VPPLPEGRAIVAVTSPLEGRRKGYARSGDATAQCCLKERRKIAGIESRGASEARHKLLGRSDNQRKVQV
jgi:hypothetical protein